MTLEGHRIKGVASLFLIGIGLAGVGFFAPDAGGHAGAFFSIAVSSPWLKFFDLAPAWCSVKIIMFSVGLFLIFDSLAIVLGRAKMKGLALALFCLEGAAFMLSLGGCFCFAKSLL
jgi:hypothetical protein